MNYRFAVRKIFLWMNGVNMGSPFFVPWQGSNYAKYRTVILSESTYDWLVEGERLSPKPDHPTHSIERAINQVDNPQYTRRLTQAICNRKNPNKRERETAWNNFAYTIYVQQSVGKGAGVRPTQPVWDEAHNMFPAQIATLDPKPRKLIITGKDAWNRMPNTVIELTPDVQAYKGYGGLLWCLALPHPANRTQGFDWQRIAQSIRIFLATTFPNEWSSS
jgi:hypothetical protein